MCSPGEDGYVVSVAERRCGVDERSDVIVRCSRPFDNSDLEGTTYQTMPLRDVQYGVRIGLEIVL